MEVIAQSTIPLIQVYHSDGTLFYTFSYNSNDFSGRNLQSYQFSRSIKKLSGDFQFTIKESTGAINNVNTQKLFFDEVDNFDVIKIYEDMDSSKPDFIGVITEISYSAMSQGLNKIVTISGKSIEYLIESLNINLDRTAMAIADKALNADIASMNAKLSLNGGQPVTVKEAVDSLFKNFTDVAKSYSNLSNSKLVDMIETFYGSLTSIFEIKGNLKFEYPITSNMYGNNVVNFYSYFHNLLNSNVYEIFGTIKNDGKPGIIIRRVPFDYFDWTFLPNSEIKAISLTDYTLTKSCNEVYTTFYSYVQGSALDATFYERATAASQGSDIVAKNLDKLSKYGYKPLQCNFEGFFTSDSSETDMTAKFKKLNATLKTWYENLDETYNGNITIVNIKGNSNAKIGEVLIAFTGEFYVTQESHSWKYKSSPKINYSVERGGHYYNGKFEPLKNLTKTLREYDTWS